MYNSIMFIKALTYMFVICSMCSFTYAPYVLVDGSTEHVATLVNYLQENVFSHDRMVLTKKLFEQELPSSLRDGNAKTFIRVNNQYTQYMASNMQLELVEKQERQMKRVEKHKFQSKDDMFDTYTSMTKSTVCDSHVKIVQDFVQNFHQEGYNPALSENTESLLSFIESLDRLMCFAEYCMQDNYVAHEVARILHDTDNHILRDLVSKIAVETYLLEQPFVFKSIDQCQRTTLSQMIYYINISNRTDCLCKTRWHWRDSIWYKCNISNELSIEDRTKPSVGLIDAGKVAKYMYVNEAMTQSFQTVKKLNQKAFDKFHKNPWSLYHISNE